MADQTQAPLGRDDVAKKVILWAGVGILAVALAVIVVGAVAYYLTDPPSERDPAELRNLILTVFNTLVPMLGTWVGTVIAFYFARENFEAASKSTRELVGQLGDDRLKQILVKDAWIPVTAIDAVVVEKGQEQTVKMLDVKKKLTNKVTRLPVWDAKRVVRYVIHESMIYKFLADRHQDAAEKAAAAAAAGQAAPPSPDLTLRDFLDCAIDGVSMETIVSKIGWVAQTATLADAKAKMEGTPNCQDVFVANTGAATEEVLGWVTNVDIAKKMKA